MAASDKTDTATKDDPKTADKATAPAPKDEPETAEAKANREREKWITAAKANGGTVAEALALLDAQLAKALGLQGPPGSALVAVLRETHYRMTGTAA